jgi:hypothetical protein
VINAIDHGGLTAALMAAEPNVEAEMAATKATGP